MRSYYAQVLGRAAAATWRFLREHIFIAALVVVAPVVGSVIWPAGEPLDKLVASVLSPLALLALLVVAVFVWNLVWAPVNLARESQEEEGKLRRKITQLEKGQEKKALSKALKIERQWRPWQPRRGAPTSGAYLGFKCSNQTDDDIPNCRIRLETLECWGEESPPWITADWFNPLLLAWSFNDGGGDTKTIGARSNRTCDLMCYESETETSATIVAAQDRLRQGNQVGFGTWRVECNVEADGYLPFELEAAFVWKPRNTPLGQLRKLEFIELEGVGSPNGQPLEAGP